MAIRTTTTAVAAILKVEDNSALDPFIETASAIIDDLVVAYPNVLTASRLELIERWLSAHMYLGSNPEVTSESALGASQSFRLQTPGEGLAATPFGQKAVDLDSTKFLRDYHKRRATLFHIGKPVT